jgi:hypothetical protein
LSEPWWIPLGPSLSEPWWIPFGLSLSKPSSAS